MTSLVDPVARMVAATKPFQAPELVAKLGDKVQIPRGLGAIGMKREQIAEMAELSTSVKRLLDNSPVSFDKAALIGILEEAF